jgi:hypothetical protein
MHIRTIILAGVCAYALTGCAGTTGQIDTTASNVGDTIPQVATSAVDLLDIVPAAVSDIASLYSAISSLWKQPAAPATKVPTS